MQNVEFFFDYICPFCYRSFLQLQEIHLNYKELNITFHPCEIHPRPSRHGKHSDLCIQGMFLAKEQNIDLWAYHEKIFEAHFKDHRDIEDLGHLADIVRDLIPPALFVKQIESGNYHSYLQKANSYAFTELGIEVVPHYKCGSEELPSIEGIGVLPDSLAYFLESMNHS